MENTSMEIRRYAVMLNNIGVLQLEKNCCMDQVLQTMKDSLSIIHKLVHDDNMLESSNERFLSDAKAKHVCAMNRLSSPLSYFNSKLVQFDSLYIADLGQSAERTSAIMSLSLEPIQPSFCLIRLDGLLDTTIVRDMSTHVSHDSETGHERSATISESFIPELETAIILYNLGVATFGMSLSSPASNQNYQTAGVKLLLSAYTMYTKSLQKISSNTFVESIEYDLSLSYLCPTQLLIGLTIVLNTIVKSLLLTAQHNQAAYYKIILSKIHSRLSSMWEAKRRLGLCPQNASAA